MGSDPIQLVAERLAASGHTVVLTGSGTSAESGVPTFRDAQTGLWAKYRPEDLATPEAFARNPEFVWDWYQWRRSIIADVQPNAGHHAIAELARRATSLTLITQNVDGLHQRAGSEHVIEFHGNIMRSKCADRGCRAEVHPGDDTSPPRCPDCGGALRPDVVWFGEPIPEAALEASLRAVGTCDLMVVAGTSAQVQPAASLATAAVERGACLVEINPESTPLTAIADFVLAGPSGRILPALVEALGSENA
ncbi:MAG: NAD-dependent deacylase [Gammaproteobacteria bacterium]|nr:NAD-dependent deacylase [Gammaproteobacteria bacterium]